MEDFSKAIGILVFVFLLFGSIIFFFGIAEQKQKIQVVERAKVSPTNIEIQKEMEFQAVMKMRSIQLEKEDREELLRKQYGANN